MWKKLRKGWKYAVAIIVGYCIHLTVEGFIVNVAWYSLIKPAISGIL